MLFFFIIEVVVVSIAASLLATWIKLVPRYPKGSHMFLQQLINTVLLTIVLTVLGAFSIYPSWFVLLVMIVVVIWLSVQITNKVVKKGDRALSEKSGGDPEERRAQ